MPQFVFALLLALIFNVGIAQNLSFEVRGIYEQSITKSKLEIAQSLSDINPGYPSSWIDKYSGVEIKLTDKEGIRSAQSQNDTLSSKQLHLLRNAGIGSSIDVKVQYHKDYNNSAKREIRFGYTIVPEAEAKFPGGYEKLSAYITDKLLEKIREMNISAIELASAAFTISKSGKISQVHISRTSGNDKVDHIMMEAIEGMQDWIPPRNSNGEAVEQEIELRIGTKIGC